MKKILINPVVKWAVHPSDQGSIDYIEGLPYNATDRALPYEGDVITRPFLVDPNTRQPVPVRVVEIQTALERRGHTLAVVVTRADRGH